MKKNKIDLSDIKEKDIDDTATFTDLMSKKEKKANDDIEDMINEKKRNTKDLTKEVKIAKEKVEKIDDTKIFDIKEERKIAAKNQEKQNSKTKPVPSGITDIGLFLLAIMSYFIYCILYTNFYDNKKVLLLNIMLVILIFVLYAFAIITNKKISKVLVIIIFILLICFIGFNLINSLEIRII